jgi:ADP-ribosylation factor protein 1
MGHLFSRMYAVLADFTKETTYRVLMLGLDQAGKTTILYKFKLGEIVKTISTIGEYEYIQLLILCYFFFESGFNIETVKPVPSISFEVWDAGGKEKYRSLLRYYFQNCQGFFFVVDSSDRDRFEEARNVLFKIVMDEFMNSVPFVVIANKSDLLMAAKPTELIEQLNLHSTPKELWYIQSVCAITGEGISEAMQQLAQLIKNNQKNGISCCINN